MSLIDDDEYNPDSHGLADCEKFEGYLCEECRIWMMEQESDWQEEARYGK